MPRAPGIPVIAGAWRTGMSDGCICVYWLPASARHDD
jgi:hypothetical protein